MKENLIDIGKSIKQSREEEIKFGKPTTVARSLCSLDNGDRTIYWLAKGGTRQMPYDKGITINKNGEFAGAIIMGVKGRFHYKDRKNKTHDLYIHNFTTYTPDYSESKVKDIVAHFDDENRVYRYATLNALLSDAYEIKERIRKEEEEKRRIEEEKIKALRKEEEAREAARIAAEEERKRLEEEAKRLEELRKQKEIEEQEKANQIARLEAAYKEANERAESFRNFIRSESSLRSQHILDPSQEKAKRSHFYDGIPIVIEGGPGTGKTTTMIQRLKYLLEEVALMEKESTLTEEQKKELLENISEKWLFFSPTPLLLNFSKNNMNEEGLSAVEGKNIITLDDFRKRMLSAYHLYNMDTNGPFRTYAQSGEKKLIKNASVAIKEFERYCVKSIVAILLSAAELNTSKFMWHRDVLGIKAICKDASKVKDIEALMRLFNSLYEHEYKAAKQKEDQNGALIKIAAIELHKVILQEDTIATELKNIFRKWDEERSGETFEVEEDEMDESNEEEDTSTESVMVDFEARLYRYLKNWLKAYALYRVDSKRKLTPRQKQVFEIIEGLVSEMNLREIGELSYFSKRYAFLCKGIESNIINQLPRLYKAYRKQILSNEAVNYYDRILLKKISDKDKNQYLHYDEQDLLIGYINNLAMFIRKRSKDRYSKMVKRCKYIRAYDENKKPVIGIDEATDYTVMDYYFMYSFRNFDYSAVTLCGDIMQGLHKNGIRDWSELKSVMPNLEVSSLSISYRQIPTLVKMARDIYFAERGEYPPYNSKYEIRDGEPQPLYYVSDDEEEKIDWIVERLLDVYRAYNKKIPSVAIFLPNGQNVDKFVNQLLLRDDLGEIKVSSGKETTITEAVKVYELSQVKGMEFEVAFFYDLDEALKGDDKQLMQRHLYVGISRAASHLAAIFKTEEGNEELFNYFSNDVTSWKL